METYSPQNISNFVLASLWPAIKYNPNSYHRSLLMVLIPYTEPPACIILTDEGWSNIWLSPSLAYIKGPFGMNKHNY